MKLRPDWAPVYVQRGLAYSNSQRHRRGIEDYTTSITLEPNNPAAFNSRGWAYLELGELTPALADLNAALRSIPLMNSHWKIA